jgi:hypothetical protein
VTYLHRRALARLPLPEIEVERLYAVYTPTSPQGERLQVFRTIRDLCESHERLRAELAGAEAMLNERPALVLTEADYPLEG